MQPTLMTWVSMIVNFTGLGKQIYLFKKQIFGGHKSLVGHKGTTYTPVLYFWRCLLWVSKPEWAVLFTHFPEMNSPLMWHQLTSRQPALQPSHYLPCTCEQALVGLKTGNYHVENDSSTDWALPINISLNVWIIKHLP